MPLTISKLLYTTHLDIEIFPPVWSLDYMQLKIVIRTLLTQDLKLNIKMKIRLLLRMRWKRRLFSSLPSLLSPLSLRA